MPPSDAKSPREAAPPDGATVPRRVLPVIVLAQLAGTSPWFAVNAVMGDLQRERGYAAADLGTLTSAVQLGFIVGTLVFALAGIADRFSTRRVFLVCALASAATTAIAVPLAGSFGALWLSRALGGFFLAGIYPVGMKIAAQWYTRGLGAALGLLIGALVLGSASPHALRAWGTAGDWSLVFFAVAALSALAGVLVIVAVPEPPRPASASGRSMVLSPRALVAMVTEARLRASVFGYFGHMWELYSLWVLVPLIVALHWQGAAASWAAFAVMAAGVLGCVGGGWASLRWGSARVAGAQLATSGLCCLIAPWALAAPVPIFIAWLLLWGATVAGDSPQFSTLTARNAPTLAQGSVLTLTNCIGFAISIASIQLFTTLAQRVDLAQLLPWLAIGPALGLLALRPLLRA
ncbi:MAG: MFS transporter [Burkholderiaceae bacterium]